MSMLMWVMAAQAQSLVVDIDEQKASSIGLDAASLEAEMEEAANGQFRLPSQEEFLSQMAAANSLSTKGMGVDYASNPQRFVVGASFGPSVNGAGASFGRGDGTLPTGGYSLQLSAMAALNLGAFSPDESALRRFVLSANGLVLSGKAGVFDADMSNFGAHLQIKLIRPPHKGAVEWGGIDLTSGIELSSYRLELSQSIPVPTDSMTWDATGKMSVTASSTSVPIELSTNLRLFVATIYLGGALDWRMNSTASTDLSLGGPLTAEYEGQSEELGSVSAQLNSTGAAGQYAPRLFAGTQVNILFFKVYGHLNVGLDKSFGGHIGARFAM